MALTQVPNSMLAFDGGPLGMRNRIINGDMRIDQRNGGASVTPTNTQYLVDRWQVGLTAASKFSAQQNAGSVTPPSGFTNYLGMTSLSAYSVATGDTFLVQQQIEGLNTSDLAWGTASAKSVTLSFYLYSSLTGTFGGSLSNFGSTRCYPFSYTVSSANTWTYITVVVSGDTTGSWQTNTNCGIVVRFGLGSGSTYSGTAGAWTGSNIIQPTSTVSVVGTSGATFYLTGVQLEVGTVATPFERRLYGQELALCQRYYSICGPVTVANQTGATVTCTGGTSFPVTMRTTPTVTGTGVTASSDIYAKVSISIAAFASSTSGTITAAAEL